MAAKQKIKKNVKLTPVDKKRCQVNKPNGNTFMTFGGVPGYIRCTNKPTIIATEIKPGLDGLIGSMSMCDDCFAMFQKQCPGEATFVRIK